MRKFVFLLFICFVYKSSFAQTAGSIDRTYGTNGYSLVNRGTDDRVYAINNTGNGKLNFISYDYRTSEVSLGRLDSAGNKDLGFGQQGFVRLASMPILNEPTFIRNQNLFKNTNDTTCMVITHTRTNAMTIHKFNNSGNYDGTFGANGILNVPLTQSVFTIPKAIFLPDGKMLVLIGSDNSPSNNESDILVVRLKTNGTRDSSFGTNGIVTIDQFTSFCTGACVSGSRDFANDMIYTSDGKILVAGSLNGSASLSYSAFFRLNANGTKDAGFGSNGIVTVFNPGWEITSVSIHEQENQKYLVSFNQWNGGSIQKSNVNRYLYNGRLDPSFNPIYMPTIPGSWRFGIVNTVVQNDNKIDVLCISDISATGRPYVVRLKVDGGLDSNFADNGVFILDTLTTLPASFFEDNYSYINQDIKGRLTLTTFALNQTAKYLLFTRLHIADVPKAVQPPVANAGTDKSTCVGMSVSIGSPAIGGNSYSWTSNPTGFNSTIANPTVSPVVNTNYFLTVTNSDGGIAKDTVNVFITAPPVANAGPDKSICSGGTGTFIGSGAIGNATYLWTPSTGLSNPAFAITVANPIVTTTYTFTVTSTINNCSSTDVVVVNVFDINSDPNITASGSTSFCQGTNLTLTSSFTTGNQWYKDAIVIPGATAPTYAVTQSGAYTVKASNGTCTTLSSNTITATAIPTPPPPVITQSDNTLISSASSGNSWYKDAALISGATNQNYLVNAPGTYAAKQTINGCTSVFSNSITVTTINTSSSLDSNVTMGPNPARDFLTIQYSGNSPSFIITVSNSSGQEIFSKEIFNNSYQLDMRNLAPGYYVVRIIDPYTNEHIERMILKG